jgi:pimeloyl-ACP methyl ester carboxylesterase
MLLVAPLAVLAAIAAALGIPATATARVAAPHLRWQGCGGGFQCARARVPLDYRQPDGRVISLALIRLPAARPRHRIGTLFVNPGGPGDSGVDFLRENSAAFPRRVRNRFTIIGFDPRGVARSTPLQCFRDFGDELETYADLPLFPMNHLEALGIERANAKLVAGCAHRMPRLAEHMTTGDVARDLNLLRRAVRDRRLSFVGYSYGSYLATVYANMFPKRVRAIVADGAINPFAWLGKGPVGTKVPIDVRLQSDTGTYAALNAFFAACDAHPVACTFAHGPSSSRWKFHRLMLLLQEQPVTTAFDGTVDYPTAVNDVRIDLYNQCCWEDLSSFLQRLWTHSSDAAAPSGAAPTAPQARERPVPRRGIASYPNGLDAATAVTCSDSHNPTDPSVWERFGIARDRVAPYFGRFWTWLDEACATWRLPAPGRYDGPFNRVTSHPLLVIGNRRDPATRYEDAVLLSRTLAKARLLTIDGTGHTSLGAWSTCARAALRRYLISLRLPAPGTVCEPDRAPFS